MSTPAKLRRERNHMMDDVPDEDLMELVQKDDEVAFNILVDRYYRRIQHYLFGYTRNRARSEDLTQETFLRVYRSRDSYRRIAKFSTWLYTIAGNLARSEYRRRKRTTMVSMHVRSNGATYEWEFPDDKPGPEDSASSSLIFDHVQKALEQVPEDFREVVVLRDMQDLSYHEIETITGVPMGTVKSRIHRGRSMLQDLLSHVYVN